MAGLLNQELQQTKPFSSREEELYLNILRTADALSRQVTELLKGYDLSLQQYNVLRILRGAGKPGLACGAIASRMISRDPDITRLLDRLERRGLVKRARQQGDRRSVHACATRQALALLARIDPELEAIHRRLIGHVPAKAQQQMIELLEDVRRGENAEN